MAGEINYACIMGAWLIHSCSIIIISVVVSLHCPALAERVAVGTICGVC